jgi:hypothetical protein
MDALDALDPAARRWGADRRAGYDSPEWERRRSWRVRHDGR